MSGMFQKCKELEYLDLSNFTTSNVTKMNHMFNECYKLKEIKGINKFITNKVIDMKGMFSECKELEYLDLSNFNTSNVIDMGWMFNECHKLKELKGLNKFITYKVTNMYAMFNKCIELEYLDLSNFNTSKVIDMSGMFNQCNKLKYLNLSNFSIKGETEGMLSFKKNKCHFITNNNDLLKLYKYYSLINLFILLLEMNPYYLQFFSNKNIYYFIFELLIYNKRMNLFINE